MQVGHASACPHLAAPPKLLFNRTSPMANHYHFITRWRVKGTAEEVYDILSEPLEYPRWWPSVYLMVREGQGHRLNLLTRGWLPYTLAWQSTTTESRRPSRI